MTSNLSSQSNPLVNQQERAEKTIFYAEDLSIPYYDNPNFLATAITPDDFTPITRPEAFFELERRGILNKDLIRILKVVGDALCANEQQIKQYMLLFHPDFGTTHTSKLLRKLAKYGLVTRYSSRLAFVEEIDGDYVKKPAPFTLGFAGINYLRHHYPEMQFVQENIWRANSSAVQRYIAMNAIRCYAAQSRNLTNFLWHPYIGGHVRIEVPLAVAVMRDKSTNNHVQFIFERAQSSHDFLSHIKRRMNLYQKLIGEQQRVSINTLASTQPQIFVISCGTVAMAKYIHAKLELGKFGMPIWFVIDEWMTKETGISRAFGQPVTKDGAPHIERFQLPIFMLQNC